MIINVGVVIIIVFQFLSSRFDVINTRSSSLINLIGQLLHHSLTVGVGPSSTHPQRITPSIATCTARFHLLNLAVQLLRGRLIANGIDRTLLREKIYNAALDYFWYVIINPSIVPLPCPLHHH